MQSVKVVSATFNKETSVLTVEYSDGKIEDIADYEQQVIIYQRIHIQQLIYLTSM